ncbi:MAG: hypothetical protein H6867_10190 [Rhodospirillales bacterium]|nr:hypothetical protein [Rhodospirillales bacterium]MCB9995847.1 hypothetical protein [Rhodospirillales bacterium]
MRLLSLIALVVIIALPAQAQTPISKDEANNFYYACKSKQDPRMSPETQDAMCACNAAMMVEHMSVEDVMTMKEQSQAGRDMLNKMLLEVYTPCINYPVQDLVQAECMRNPNMARAGGSLEQVCACAAEKTAQWFAKDGKTLMRQILERTPNILDPIEPIMESRDFKGASYSNMMACLK